MTLEYVGYRLRCPVCGAELYVEVPAGAHPRARDTDFRPVFEGPDPVAAALHLCPECHYAAYLHGFEHGSLDEDDRDLLFIDPAPVRPGELPDEEDLQDLRRYVRSGELAGDLDFTGRDPTPAERYLLAARCREFLGDEDEVAVADLYLRGAWCARGHEPEMEKRLLADASLHLSRALDAGVVPEPDRPRLTYLAAEVSRRAGEFGKAVDLFGQVEAPRDPDDVEAQRLDRLARRQESLAAMQSAVNARMPEEEEVEEGEEDEG